MKYHPRGSVLFVTFSVEEGLLFLSNPLCTAIIQSCLVATYLLYPVRISHITVEATHIHMVITVLDPDHVNAFIRHFKTESAHAINTIQGRKKRTVWCEGYDSPRILTLSKAMSVISYIYCNPAKDNLVSSINEYPGFSTWKMFTSGETTKMWRRFRRPQFRCLADKRSIRVEYINMLKELRKKAREVLARWILGDRTAEYPPGLSNLFPLFSVSPDFRVAFTS